MGQLKWQWWQHGNPVNHNSIILKEQECQGINKLVIFIKILSNSKVTASRFAIKFQPIKSSDDSHAEFVNQYDD